MRSLMPSLPGRISLKGNIRLAAIAQPSYLQAQAALLSSGQSSTLSLTGLSEALIDMGAGENMLEYGHKGVFTNGRFYYLGGPHSNGINQVFLEYIESTNTIARITAPSSGYTLHGYDHCTADTSGNVYTRRTNTNVFDKFNGSSWANSIPNNSFMSAAGEPACGFDYSPTRNALLAFDDTAGLTQHVLGAGAWTQLATAASFTGLAGSFHFVVVAHRNNDTVWIQDGSGNNHHWRLNANNTITTLATPPINLGCSGAGGKYSFHDVGSGKFIVQDPATNHIWEFDLANDSWVDKGVKMDMNNAAVEGLVIAVPAYGCAIYIAVHDGTPPQAVLYKI